MLNHTTAPQSGSSTLGLASASDAAQPNMSAMNLELMDLLGYIYLQHSQPDKAAILLAARDALAPDNPKTLLTLAVAQLRSDKAQRALSTLERLILLGAVDPCFHLVRGQALQQLGRDTEAASAMRAHIAARSAAMAPSETSQTGKTTP